MASLLSIGGVACGISADSGVQEEQPRDGAKATVVYQCDHADRYALLRQLMPQAYAAGASFVRSLPHAYPPSPNLYCLDVTSIQGIAPYTGTDGFLRYREAKVTAVYSAPTFSLTGGNFDPAGGGDPSGQPWTTTTFEVGIDVIKLPGGGYVLSNGESLEEGVTGIQLPGVTIRMKRHFCARVPLAEMIAVGGYINSAPIKFANYTFPRGTLLFAGGATSQARDTAFATTTELEYVLVGRTQGLDWNKFLSRSGTWLFANTTQALTGLYPYQYADLRALP